MKIAILAITSLLLAGGSAHATNRCGVGSIPLSNGVASRQFNNLKTVSFTKRGAMRGVATLDLMGYVDPEDGSNGTHAITFADNTYGDVSAVARSALFCKKVVDRFKKILADNGITAASGKNYRTPNGGLYARIKLEFECTPISGYAGGNNAPVIKSCILDDKAPEDLLAEAKAEIEAENAAFAPPPPATTSNPPPNKAASGPAGTMTRQKK